MHRHPIIEFARYGFVRPQALCLDFAQVPHCNIPGKPRPPLKVIPTIPVVDVRVGRTDETQYVSTLR